MIVCAESRAILAWLLDEESGSQGLALLSLDDRIRRATRPLGLRVRPD